MNAKTWWDEASLDQILMVVSSVSMGGNGAHDLGNARDVRKLRLWCQAIVGREALHGYWHEANYPGAPDLWLRGWRQGLRGQPGEEAQLARARLLWDEVMGNPAEAVHVDPAWLTWNEGTVPQLAEAAYANPGWPCGWCEGQGRWSDRSTGASGGCTYCHGTGRRGEGALDPVRLAVLADALEEAGCQDQGVLGHLKDTTRPHYRVCWALNHFLPEKLRVNAHGDVLEPGQGR